MQIVGLIWIGQVATAKRPCYKSAALADPTQSFNQDQHVIQHR